MTSPEDEQHRVERAESIERGRVTRAEGLENDRVRRAEGVEQVRVDRAIALRRGVIPMFTCLALIIAVLSGLALYNSQRIANDQDHATATLRAANAQTKGEIATLIDINYRYCVRINDTRGVTLLRLRALPGGSRELASDLPMYNCTRTLSSGVQRMTPAQVEAYLRILAAGKAAGP